MLNCTRNSCSEDEAAMTRRSGRKQTGEMSPAPETRSMKRLRFYVDLKHSVNDSIADSKLTIVDYINKINLCYLVHPILGKFVRVNVVIRKTLIFLGKYYSLVRLNASTSF